MKYFIYLFITCFLIAGFICLKDYLKNNANLVNCHNEDYSEQITCNESSNKEKKIEALKEEIKELKQLRKLKAIKEQNTYKLNNSIVIRLRSNEKRLREAEQYLSMKEHLSVYLLNELRKELKESNRIARCHSEYKKSKIKRCIRNRF